VARNQQKFISHSSGGWTFKIRHRQFQCVVRAASWFIGCCLLARSFHGRKRKGSTLGIFYKGPSPIPEGSGLMTSRLLKIHLGDEIFNI
jgi:hypothetical protein